MKTLWKSTVLCLLLALPSRAFGQPVGTLPTRCNVHHTPLKKEWVKIEYGLIYLPPETMEAERTLFPYSNRFAYGGCCPLVIINAKTGRARQSVAFKEVEYCSKCRSAEYLWTKKNAEHNRLKMVPIKPEPVQKLAVEGHNGVLLN